MLGVCRRVLRHEQDAEDVSQGTFLVLARKAGRLPWQSSVQGWLCAVAYRLARNALVAGSRRLKRETLPYPVSSSSSGLDDDTLMLLPHHTPQDPAVEASRRELRLLLHDELGRLPDKYRAPLVLCYLEGKTSQEAARLLGWPAGSMSRRLARARSLLGQRLTRRGIALAIFLLCLGLLCFGAFSRGPADGPKGSTEVARAMRTLRTGPEGKPGAETMLRRLANGSEPAPQLDRENLLWLAEQAAVASERISGHAPPSRRDDWMGYAQTMRWSARALAAAAQERDEGAILLAARQLQASCQQCHAVFRP